MCARTCFGVDVSEDAGLDLREDAGLVFESSRPVFSGRDNLGTLSVFVCLAGELILEVFFLGIKSSNNPPKLSDIRELLVSCCGISGTTARCSSVTVTWTGMFAMDFSSTIVEICLRRLWFVSFSSCSCSVSLATYQNSRVYD